MVDLPIKKKAASEVQRDRAVENIILKRIVQNLNLANTIFSNQQKDVFNLLNNNDDETIMLLEQRNRYSRGVTRRIWLSS